MVAASSRDHPTSSPTISSACRDACGPNVERRVVDGEYEPVGGAGRRERKAEENGLHERQGREERAREPEGEHGHRRVLAGHRGEPGGEAERHGDRGDACSYRCTRRACRRYCPHPLQCRLDARLVVERRHGDAEALEAGAKLRPLELPEAQGDSLDLVRRRVEVRLGRHLEHDEVVAAPAQVDERRHGPFVEERGEGHDERACRQRPRGDDVDVLPGVAELDACLEQRVDEAIALHEPAPRLEPAQDPAEGDEADPVTPLEEA